MTNDDRSPTSRRTVLRAGMGLVAGAAVAGAAHAADAPPKLAKSVVMYQDSPKNGQKCSECVHFVAPSSCKIVEGTISPNGWCGAFAPKQA